MEVCEVTDRDLWSGFVHAHAPVSGAFLQTWEWGEFETIGRRSIRRIGVFAQGELCAVAQLVFHLLPFERSYAFCPHGPLFAISGADRQKIFEALIAFLQKEKNVLFFRCEPVEEDRFSPKGGRQSIPLHPPHTLVTDLRDDPERLLSRMHPKTRYNIRLAQRKGVVVRIGEDVDIERVWVIFKETAIRDGFRLHPKSHYERMLQTLQGPKGPRAFLATAEFNGTVLAANLLVDYGSVRTYLHGASSDQLRALMAPYVLHWELMLDARERRMKTYDWWGIAAEDGSQPEWTGLTRFKKGFGGEEISYPGTFDLPLQPFAYRGYKILRLGVRTARSWLGK